MYKEYNLTRISCIFRVVSFSKDYPNNQDAEKDDIFFLEENGYSFPTVFDESGEVLHNYNISAFPTTFMIDKEETSEYVQV